MSESTLIPIMDARWKSNVVECLGVLVGGFNAQSGPLSGSRYSWAFDKDGHKYMRLRPYDDDLLAGPVYVRDFNEFFKTWQIATGCTANFKWEGYEEAPVLAITEIVLPLYKDEGPAPDAFAKAILAEIPTKVGAI